MAHAHLSSCRFCQQFFESERSFLSWLRPQLQPEQAPPRLRQRLRDRLARPKETRAFSGYRRAFWLAAGLAVLVAGSLLYNRPSKAGISQAEAALIEDHIRYLPSRERAEFQTSEGEEAARWFSEKLHFPVRAPEIPRGRLQGGRLCFLLGSRVALLFYEVQGRPLSFFVLDGQSLDLKSARFEDYQGKKLCRASKSGYHLALWQEAGLVYAIVSDVPTDSLLRLAARL